LPLMARNPAEIVPQRGFLATPNQTSVNSTTMLPRVALE
jgi:hypothetical protein